MTERARLIQRIQGLLRVAAHTTHAAEAATFRAAAARLQRMHGVSEAELEEGAHVELLLEALPHASLWRWMLAEAAAVIHGVTACDRGPAIYLRGRPGAVGAARAEYTYYVDRARRLAHRHLGRTWIPPLHDALCYAYGESIFQRARRLHPEPPGAGRAPADEEPHDEAAARLIAEVQAYDHRALHLGGRLGLLEAVHDRPRLPGVVARPPDERPSSWISTRCNIPYATMGSPAVRLSAC